MSRCGSVRDMSARSKSNNSRGLAFLTVSSKTDHTVSRIREQRADTSSLLIAIL